MRPLLCILGLRHCWETHSDSEGAVITCSRCGKLRHVGIADLRTILDEAPGDPISNHAESVTIQNTQYLDP